MVICIYFLSLFFKQKTAYEMRISDWSSDVCSSDLPGLQAAQLGEIVPSGPVDQCIFIDPADAGRVGTDRAARGFGQAALHLIEIFKDSRACPIEISAVLEDHINKAIAEERIGPAGLCSGHRQHRRGERTGEIGRAHV